MKLNFRTLGKGEPLFILHGIFGSADNWQSVGRQLADHFRVYLIDLRNHGSSPHDKVFNYEVMVEDLFEMVTTEKLENISLLGHSMGGKTAMKFAVSHANLVNNLVVVDIAPKYYAPHHNQIFEGFDAVPLRSIASRKDADHAMSQLIAEVETRQFLLKNLSRNADGYYWKLNLDAIKKNIEKIGMGLNEDEIFEGSSCFIRGVKSDYISQSDYEKIHLHFPNADIISIDGAGHWVHADQPDKLLHAILNFLL